MLSIIRLNSAPVPDGNGLYEANTIYLVKTDTSFVHILFTSPTGTLVGESIQPINIVEQVSITPTADKDASLFWFDAATGEVYIKKHVNEVYSWELIGANSLQKANNLADLTDAMTAGVNLGLGDLAYKDNVTSTDIATALGYVPADAAALAGIDTILQSILDPIGSPDGELAS